MVRDRTSRREPVAPPSRVRALFDRYAKHLTLVGVSVVLVIGLLGVLRYRRSRESQRGQAELDKVLALDAKQQVEHLQRLAGEFGGTDAAPAIRYRLGCAQLKVERYDHAAVTFRQLAQDAPDTPWGALAGKAAREAGEEDARRAKAGERVNALRAEADAQRRFSGSPPDANPREAALPVPRRPGVASAASALDPSRFSGVDRP